MDREQVVATWISFMATAFRKVRGLTRTQFIELSKKYRIIPFLADHYELLHYYDNTYVVNDIVRYIAGQGGSLDEPP